MLKIDFLRILHRMVRFVVFAACSMLVFGLGSHGTAHAETAPKPYRIGAILPLSGSVASLGKMLKSGIDLAYSKLSKEQAARLEVVYEDDQYDPKSTVAAYYKLRSTHAIDAVFVLATTPAKAIAPLTEKDGVVLIGIGASDPYISRGRKFAFTHWVSPEAESSAMIREIQRRGYKKVAFATAEAEGTIAIRESILVDMTAKGLVSKVVLNESFLTDETSFRTFITKARAKEVDVIIVTLFPGPLAAFASEVKRSGLKADLAGLEMFENPGEVKASGGALIGQWYVAADTPDRSFEEAFKAKYREQPSWAAANAYDATNLVAQAVSGSARDNEQVVKFLTGLKDYRGAAGIYSATGDNRFTLPAAVKVVTATGFEKVSAANN